MNRLCLLLVMAVTGCSQSHVSDDAAHVADAAVSDGFVMPMPDAACTDADGDGFGAAACGGADCDDTDPTVHPGAERCVGPTEVERCEAGTLVRAACADPTPDCDARTGHCAESACGDGVMHPDEQCDALDHCNYECRAICYRQVDCAAAGGSCIPRPMGEPACAVYDASRRPNGSDCESDDDCASGWCDPASRHCSWSCTGQYDCNFETPSWCGISAMEAFSFERLDPSYRCEVECHAPNQCSSGNTCAMLLVQTASGTTLASACRPSRGTAALGASCRPGECDNCLDGTCTSVCSSDDDCAPPLPHCLPYAGRGGGFPVPRPPEWGAGPSTCQP